MKKTRTNEKQHECTFCKDLFYGSSNYRWQCSDYCRLMISFEKVGECWVVRRKNKARYGTFKYLNRAMGSHRASYLILKGEIPEGMEVCHTCDIRQCINPDHLFLGTKAQNMQDCLKKGLMSIGGKHYIAKLTEKDVIDIRYLKHSKPWMKYREIAELYGVTQETIYDIIKQRTWKHVL